MKTRNGKLIFLLISSCCLLVFFFAGCASAPNSSIGDAYGETVDDAAQIYLDTKRFDKSIPYATQEISPYIFLSYNGVMTHGMYYESHGYRYALKLGFKLIAYVPPTDSPISGFIDGVNLTKVGSDYIIDVAGKKTYQEASIFDENSTVNVFDNRSNYGVMVTDDAEDERCFWVNVVGDMSDDYKLYFAIDNVEYQILSGKEIIDLVG